MPRMRDARAAATASICEAQLGEPLDRFQKARKAAKSFNFGQFWWPFSLTPGDQRL
jgi:hypothetical protein